MTGIKKRENDKKKRREEIIKKIVATIQLKNVEKNECKICKKTLLIFNFLEHSKICDDCYDEKIKQCNERYKNFIRYGRTTQKKKQD